VALGSRIIAEKIDSEWVDDAFIAGLLHDAGKIILDPYILERKKAFKRALGNGQPRFIDAEKEILGFDHAEVMSRAVRFWRYPENQSTAIRYHHYPSRSEDSELAFIVHLADFVAKEAGFKSEEGALPSEIEPPTLRYLGFQKEDLSSIIAEITESVEKLANEFN
jgi:HD-like signal output (HDOD) protein